MRKKGSAAIENLKYKMLAVSMVNILVVSSMLGSQGAGYLGVSLAVLTICASLHSAWLSATLKRYVRGRNVRNQYRSSEKFLRAGLLYAVLSGGIWCVLFTVFANKLGGFLVRDIHISICIMLMGPILLTYALSEAFTGYFRGARMVQPVKIAMFVRQAVFFVGSIIGMKSLSAYGGKIAKLLHNDAITCVYGAFGAMLGLLAGNIVGFLILVVFRGLLHGEFSRMQNQDTAKHRETVFHGFRTLTGTGFFQGLKWVFITAPLPINYILYVRLCKTDIDSTAWIKTGGYLFGIAVPLMFLIVLVFAFLNQKNYRQLAQNLKSESYGQFSEKISAILLSVAALVLPACAVLLVMAKPMIKLLLGSSSEEAATILMLSAVSALLLTMEIIALKLYQARNETGYSLLSVFAGFVVQTALVFLIFQFVSQGFAGIFIGLFIEAAIVIILFFVKYKKRLKFPAYFIKKMIMLGIIAFGSALIMFFIYLLIEENLKPGASLAISVIPGLALYFGILAFVPIISSEEAADMPGGGLIIQLKRFVHRE